ncbi:hypothetical protein PSPO01_07892 [Paraphaeosphaeria sporulosa]
MLNYACKKLEGEQQRFGWVADNKPHFELNTGAECHLGYHGAPGYPWVQQHADVAGDALGGRDDGCRFVPVDGLHNGSDDDAVGELECLWYAIDNKHLMATGTTSSPTPIRQVTLVVPYSARKRAEKNNRQSTT